MQMRYRLLIAVAAAIGATVVLRMPARQAQAVVGTVGTVYEGDTFGLWEADRCVRIRICGIDCPEAGRSGSQHSTDTLKALLAGRTIRCRPVGRGTVCDGRSPGKSRTRIVAQC